MQSLQDYAVLPKVVFLTRKSRELGKLASAGKGSLSENALLEKVATDTVLVDELTKLGHRLLAGLQDGESLIKAEEDKQKEQDWQDGQDGQAKKKEEIEKGSALDKEGFWPSAGKGLAAAAGASIPAGMLGSYLINRAGAEKEKRLKNLLLPVAGTILGTTAGLMGLSRLAGPSPEDPEKRSFVENAVIYEKFATAVETRTHINNTLLESTDDDVRKLAAETLVIANAHIADIAGDVLLDKSAASLERAKTSAFGKTTQGEAWPDAPQAPPANQFTAGTGLEGWSPRNYRTSTNPLHAQLSNMGDRRFWSGYGYDPFRAGGTYADELEGTQVPDYEMPQVQGYQGVAGTTPVQRYEGTAPQQGGGLIHGYEAQAPQTFGSQWSSKDKVLPGNVVTTPGGVMEFPGMQFDYSGGPKAKMLAGGGDVRRTTTSPIPSALVNTQAQLSQIASGDLSAQQLASSQGMDPSELARLQMQGAGLDLPFEESVAQTRVAPSGDPFQMENDFREEIPGIAELGGPRDATSSELMDAPVPADTRTVEDILQDFDAGDYPDTVASAATPLPPSLDEEDLPASMQG